MPFIPQLAVIACSITLNYKTRKHKSDNAEALAQAKQILSKVTDMVVITDSIGKIVLTNDSFKNLSGYSEKELLERNIASLITFSILPGSKDIRRGQIIAHGNTFIPVDISESRIYSKDSTMLGTAYVLRDIGTVSKINEEILKDDALTKSLSDMNEQFKELDKLKSNFLSNVSHELRTPLNLMISSLKLSAFKLNQSNGMVDPSLIYKHFDIMNQNCFRLTRIINNIIDITRIDAGALQLNLSNNNIVEIVEETVLSVASFIEKKGMTLIFDTDVEEKYIACDLDQIQRVLLNLISNAVKFNNNGREIFVSIKEASEIIKISVKDSGIGISPENQQLIFDRFIQVDKSLTRQHEGCGIGLAITKYLVELHKGTITLESELDRGSTFTITLPVYLVPNSIAKRVSPFATLNEKVNIEFSDVI
ncbi:MAG TPA: PAS domain-containing sensor histidine kinase [Ruminiclostridium sp.]|nr:PAS domain-containing sensor histidine kinase [Ruminiclostridium sp.]